MIDRMEDITTKHLKVIAETYPIEREVLGIKASKLDIGRYKWGNVSADKRAGDKVEHT